MKSNLTEQSTLEETLNCLMKRLLIEIQSWAERSETQQDRYANGQLIFQSQIGVI